MPFVMKYYKPTSISGMEENSCSKFSKSVPRTHQSLRPQRPPANAVLEHRRPRTKIPAALILDAPQITSMPFTAPETPERAHVAFADRRLPLPFPSPSRSRYAPYTSHLATIQPRSKTPPPHTPARAYSPVPALHASKHPLCRPQTPPRSRPITLPETPGFALAPFALRPTLSSVERQRSQTFTLTPRSGLPSPPASPSKPSTSSSKHSALSSKVFSSSSKPSSSSSESSSSSRPLELPPISVPTEPLSPPPSPSKPSFWRAPTRADPLDKYWRDRKAFYVGHLEHVLHGPVHETNDEREETVEALDVSAVDELNECAEQIGAGTEDEQAQGVEEPPLAVEDEPIDVEIISEDDDTDDLWTPSVTCVERSPSVYSDSARPILGKRKRVSSGSHSRPSKRAKTSRTSFTWRSHVPANTLLNVSSSASLTATQRIIMRPVKELSRLRQRPNAFAFYASLQLAPNQLKALGMLDHNLDWDERIAYLNSDRWIVPGSVDVFDVTCRGCSKTIALERPREDKSEEVGYYHGNWNKHRNLCESVYARWREENGLPPVQEVRKSRRRGARFL